MASGKPVRLRHHHFSQLIQRVDLYLPGRPTGGDDFKAAGIGHAKNEFGVVVVSRDGRTAACFSDRQGLASGF